MCVCVGGVGPVRVRKREIYLGTPKGISLPRLSITYKEIKTIKLVEWTAGGYQNSSPDSVLEAYPVRRSFLRFAAGRKKQVSKK